MSARDPVREVLDDVRYELRRRPAQVAAFVTYVVLLGGAIYLFSSIGADSRTAFDTVERRTLSAIGAALLDVGVLVGAVALVLDRNARLGGRSGSQPLGSRKRFVVVLAAALAVSVVGWIAWLP